MTKINDAGLEPKPCPFCGGEALQWKCLGGEAMACCKQTDCPGYDVLCDLNAWNRRADLVPAPSVTVKPLEWEDHEGQSYAIGAGAEYLVELSHNGSWYYEDVAGPFDSLDAAKAAAQADYEARIMAAIQIGPAPAPPSEGVEP